MTTAATDRLGLIARAQECRSSWRRTCRDAEDAYQEYSSRGDAGAGKWMNLLWSTMQIIPPSILPSLPGPSVRQRAGALDQTKASAAGVLRDALTNSADTGGMRVAAAQAVWQMAMYGIGLCRVDYYPTVTGDSDEEQVVTGEEVRYRCVRYDRIAYDTGVEVWGDMAWMAFRHDLSRDEFSDRWPDVEPPGCNAPESPYREDQDKDRDDRVTVWEFWDRRSGMVSWVADGLTDALEEYQPPTRLHGFFPVSAPAWYSAPGRHLTPIPLYGILQRLLDQHEVLRSDIARLTSALRARGIYPSSISEIESLMMAGDAEMVPSESVQAIMALTGGGGLDRAIWMWPVESIMSMLIAKRGELERVEADIHKMSGISDIMRGATKAAETATAQALKAEWGGIVLGTRQASVDDMLSSAYAIGAEIMAENVTDQGLAAFAGGQISMDVLAILRDDPVRTMAVSVSTESRHAETDTRRQADAARLLSGVTQYLTGVAPLVQAGVIPVEAARSILMEAARHSGFGRDTMDSLALIGRPPQPQIAQQQGAVDMSALQGLMGAQQ
jgi:hypothetical protein